MSLTTRCVIVAAWAITALGAAPAGADDSADSADTRVRFEVVAAGGLYVSAPCAARLPDVPPGATASGHLGEVRVTDERAARDATWIATVTVSQDFTTGSPGAHETISGGRVAYRPGAAIDPFNGPFTPGHPGPLATFRTAFSHPRGYGSNSVAWNPTLKVHVPEAGVAGIYRGVVTHSVA
jgi:hypothetical protein